MYIIIIRGDGYAQVGAESQILSNRHFIHFPTTQGLSNTWISDLQQDRNGFMWIATQYGLNRYDGVAFESFVYSADDSSSLSVNWVKAISEDMDGNIWIGPYGEGINKYDPIVETFTRYHDAVDDPCYMKGVESIISDSLHRLWISLKLGRELLVYEDGLCIMREGYADLIQDMVATKDWVIISTSNSIQVYDALSLNQVSAYTVDHKIGQITISGDTLLFAQGKSIWSATLTTLGVIEAPQERYKCDAQINDVILIDNIVYAGCANGLAAYNLTNGQSKKYTPQPGRKNSIVGGDILTLEVDRDNNLWIGSREGLCMMPSTYQSFEYSGSNVKLKKEKRVHAILPLARGTYVGSESGLLFFDNYNSREFIATGLRIRTFLQDQDGYIYAGVSSAASESSSERILKIDPKTNRVIKKYLPFFDRVNAPGRVFSLAQDAAGGIIATIDNQVYYKGKFSEEFSNYSDRIPFDFSEVGQLLNIVLDNAGHLWIGAIQGGLIRINWNNAQAGLYAADVIHYKHDPDNKNSICSNFIPYVFMSSDGLIWIATDGGINTFDIEASIFERYTRSDGLISDKVLSITEDEYGQVWMATISHGLLSVNKDKSRFRFHREKSGIYHDAFLLQSVGKSNDGVLYFGNEGGLQIFKPQPPIDDIVGLPEPVLSRLYINNEEIKPSTSSILTAAPEYTSDITLGHRENNITVSYAHPYYGLEDDCRYAYRLTGASEDWVSIDQLSQISFAQLSSGEYILEVKVCIASSCITSDPLSISIRAAWWYSSLAWLIYAALLLGSIWLIFQKREKAKIEHLQIEKRAAIQQSQSRFYTNMTHELRTPLTLISGPVQRLISNGDIRDPNAKTLLTTIKSNTDHMLKLVNNLLDFSKIESGMMPIQNRPTELGPFFSTLIDAFRPDAVSRNIELITELTGAGMTVLLDREKTTIILSNLLANAIKYTHEGDSIHVDIEAKESSFLMSVADTGIGMTKDELDHLFDRYYRAETVSTLGSGVGMSLVREIVELLKGTIKVDSTKGKGTTVIVTCPITTVEQTKIVSELIETTHEDAEESTSMPIVLLIEDQPEVASFVSSGLSSIYKVISANNGKSGCELALEKLPDLIITDVMMPGMDGYQVSRYLKSHNLTDHIPIVMLTARADQASRIEGMDSGADGFLTKPFDDRELTLLLSNLLSTRDSILNKKVDTKPTATPKALSPFLKRTEEHVMKLMSEDDLSVPALCSSLLVSRTQLHRKLKGETGMSTTQYLNKIKLSHASLLLSTTDLSIAEIVYQCGFNHPSYFSQVFLKNYNCTPGEYRLKAK